MATSDLRLPAELLESFSTGNGAIWLGAGTSVGSGLPTWEGLVKSMAQRLLKESDISEYDIKHHLDILETSELFREIVGHNYYYNFLRSEISARSLKAISDSENMTLQAVAAFINHFWPKPGITVISTNYDTLLEECLLVRHGKKARPIVSSTDIATADYHSDLNVLKPNGDINHPESIILTLSDYCQYRTQKPYFVTALADLLAKKTILFVGYGLRDFTVNSIIGELQTGRGSFKRRAFLLTKDAQAAKRRVLRSLGVEVINISSYDDIPFVLRAVSHQQATVDIVIRRIEQLPPQVREMLASARLLIIDDDQDILDTVSWIYQHYGWRKVEVLSDPREAVKRIGTTKYDFILTDYMMGPIDGIGITKAARSSKRNRRAIVAIWSGYMYRDRFFDAGADAYFDKLAGIDEIISHIYVLKRLRDGNYK